MDLVAIGQMAARHWKLVVIGVIAAVLVTLLAVSTVAPTYMTEGTMELAPPNSIPGGTGSNNLQNPALALGSSLVTFASIVATVADSHVTQERLQARGLDTNYTVSVPSDLPVLDISVQASTPKRAQATFAALETEVKRISRKNQQANGSPPSQYITTKLIVAPATQRTTGAKPRVAVGAFGLAMLLVLGLVVLVDWRGRAKRRKSMPALEREGRGRESAQTTPGSARGLREGPSGARWHDRVAELTSALEERPRPTDS